MSADGRLDPHRPLRVHSAQTESRDGASGSASGDDQHTATAEAVPTMRDYRNPRTLIERGFVHGAGEELKIVPSVVIIITIM